MEQQKLRELLESLHQELEHVDSIDDATSTVLQRLREDTQRLLADQSSVASADSSLVERMNHALEHFEEAHPKLSVTIQHVLDSLAKMGL